MAQSTTVLGVVIALAILGVLIWLYVEQAKYLFEKENFTAQGEQDWRRTLTIVFVILALISVCLSVFGILFGGYIMW
jgi:hypothetical protein